MGQEDASLQSKCVIFIFLAVRGVTVESVTALWFAALIFGYDRLYPHSSLLNIYLLCFCVLLWQSGLLG